MTERNFHLRNKCIEEANNECANCGQTASQAHHVVPLILGGFDKLSNLVALCEECHGKVHGTKLSNHSELTRKGLNQARERGVKLGGIRPKTITRNDEAKERALAAAERLRPLLSPMVAQGASLRQMAAALANAGCTTRNGKPLSPSTVALHLDRLGLRGEGWCVWDEE